MMPLTAIGVPSSLFSGRGPRLSVLNRQATSRLLKVCPLMSASGEYLLPRRSAVYIGQSPLLVEGCPVLFAWPTADAAIHAMPPAAPSTMVIDLILKIALIRASRFSRVSRDTGLQYQNPPAHKY